MPSEEAPSSGYVVGNSTEIDPIYARGHSHAQLEALKRRLRAIRLSYPSNVKTSELTPSSLLEWYKWYRRAGQAQNNIPVMGGYLGQPTPPPDLTQQEALALFLEGTQDPAYHTLAPPVPEPPVLAPPVKVSMDLASVTQLINAFATPRDDAMLGFMAPPPGSGGNMGGLHRLLMSLSAAGSPGQYKQADHPQDRLKERTSLPANYTHRLRRVLAKTTLPKGNAYARMPDNSFAVFKDAGGKKRLASFLSKHMTPRGKDITVPVREGLRKTSASVVPGDGKSRAETAREVKGALNTFLLGRGLDPDKATLVAGGAMYFNGLKGHITDVDFFHPDMPNFVKERVGRFDLDGGPGADIASEAHSSHKIHGLRVQTPSGMLAFYEHLNRPKDQEKIKLLRLLPDAQKTPADARLRKTSAVASTATPAEARLRVAILNGSMNEDSRSRALATAYAKELRRLGADVDTLDMRDMGDLPDVITGNSSVLNPYLDRFQNSDAFVVSSPVHNWGPSSKVMGFLEHALDSDSMAYRPYSILSGAGSSRSALAMGGLANQLDMELKGIGIGAGVQAAGDDYDPVTNKLKAAIVRRAKENAGKLYAVANAMRDGPAKTAEVYYHGSNKKLDSLRAGSWVTPHQEDALSFGVPWSSKDLVDSGGSDGRPPQALEFKPGREPKDGPVYVYKTNTTAVKDAKTNTGKSYDWNRQVTKDTPVTLVESHPSWKDKLLVPGARKTASIPEDAVAYSAVPDIASAMEHGLLSSHAIAARPDLLEIARPDPEQREAWKKRLASETRRVHRRGPNVFFTPPDPDKIGPQHYINKDNLKTVEVALGRLMRDQPDTRVYGLELVPFGTEGKREGYLSHKKLRELLGSDPKELWQHYDDPVGRYYAANVPHGAVVTESGVIDPKYLKTSSDQSLEHLRSLLARFKKDADKSGYNYFVVAHGDDPAVGAETSRVHGQPDSVVREHKKLHLDFSKSIGAEHVNWGSKTASIPEDAVAY